MELKKLKNILFIKGIKYKEVAKSIGISTTTFSNKINGKVDFTVSEIRELTKLLNLTNEEIKDIFF